MRPFLLGVSRNIYCFPSANTPTKMLATNLKLLFAFTTRRQQTTTCCLCTPHTSKNFYTYIQFRFSKHEMISRCVPNFIPIWRELKIFCVTLKLTVPPNHTFLSGEASWGDSTITSMTDLCQEIHQDGKCEMFQSRQLQLGRGTLSVLKWTHWKGWLMLHKGEEVNVLAVNWL